MTWLKVDDSFWSHPKTMMLSSDAIAYLPPSRFLQTVHIRPPGAVGGKQFTDYPFARALEEMAA